MNARHLGGAAVLFFIASTVTMVNGFSNRYWAMNYSGRGLIDTPEEVPGNTTLLNMLNNNLTSLTDQFWSSRCGRGDYSASCSRFPYMDLLDLSKNKIENISSHCFSGMPNLRRLILSSNNLRSIPHDIFQRNHLVTSIFLSGNRIRYLNPETVQNLPELRFLYLDNNDIGSLHQDTFRGIRSLTDLNISTNYISELHIDLFVDLQNLRYLRINHNCLTHLPETAFRNLNSLTELDVAHNELLDLSPTFFFFAKSLEKIDLSHNLLRKISKFAFQDMLRVKHVNVAFNGLESIYMSRISVSLSSANTTNVLVRETGLCTGKQSSKDIPCFISKDNLITEIFPRLSVLHDGHAENVFHSVNFSFNDIREIIFNKNEDSHTLEIIEIFLAGNPYLSLPVQFLRQEKYITALVLDGTRLGWRNITLLNEITELPHLKYLSIVGCGACEHYMKVLIFSVFNPNNQIPIVCGGEDSLDEDLPQVAVGVGWHSNEIPESVVLNHNCSERLAKITDFNTSRDPLYYPCQSLDKKTVIHETFFNENRSINCEYTMDCSFVMLSALPSINSSATCVFLAHNDIEVIAHNYFSSFWRMTYLDLSFNRLSYLHAEVFSNPNKLEVLKMNNNLLTHLNSSAFVILTKLSVLTLHGNQISSYEPDALSAMKEIELLSIEFRNLTRFHHETFQNLHNLVKLELKEMSGVSPFNNTLSEKHFENLQNLKFCEIFGFMFNGSTIHALFQSNSLETLTIEKSYLPRLTAMSFYNATYVKSITLRRNQIKYLDRYVFRSLYNLDTLDVSHNKISFIHNGSLENMHSLRLLNMSHNQIFCIHSTLFHSLNSLEILDLSFNYISNLDFRYFSNLCNVQFIYLVGNRLGRANNLTDENYYDSDGLEIRPVNSTILTSNILDCLEGNTHLPLTNIGKNFSQYDSLITNYTEKLNHITNRTGNVSVVCPPLRTLTLAFNNVVEIDNEAFKDMTLLQMLNLSHNYMIFINEHLLRNLALLEKLDLSHNHLKSIENNAFRFLGFLEVLYVDFNELKSFVFQTDVKESRLRELRLSSNQLTETIIKPETPYLAKLFLNNNPLRVERLNIFDKLLPLISQLDVSNTSLCKLNNDSFSNLSGLSCITLGSNCLQGLIPLHFASLQDLVVLDMSIQRSDYTEEYSHLSWKNMTLLNYWFEMQYIDYLVLSGQPICEPSSWKQIIEELFLPTKWIWVICTDQNSVPDFIVNRNGTKVISFF